MKKILSLCRPRVLLFFLGLAIGITLLFFGIIENFEEIRMEASEL